MQSSLRLAALFATGVSFGSMAIAATPLSGTVTATAAQALTGTQVATVSGAGATNTSVNPLSVADVSVARFDTSTAILVGARATLNTAVTTTNSVVGTFGANANRALTGNASLTGTVSGAGLNFSSGPVVAAATCSGGNCVNQGQLLNTNGTISGTQTVANLANVAGPGNVVFTRSAAGTTRITNGAAATTPVGTSTGRFTFGGATQANNLYSITYDFLNFANPSFSSAIDDNALTLNFGNVLINSAPVTFNLFLTNFGNVNSADLALNSIVPTNAMSAFSTSLATFSNLAGGASVGYSATFAPTMLGAASQFFTLNFADNAGSGSVGGKNYQLVIEASGVGVGIPEPATWAMFIIGFGAIGVSQRRRAARRTVAA
jgi:hypothetical protein